MFVLSSLKDIAKVESRKFAQDQLSVVSTILENKFANKVVVNLGLCICLFDVTGVEDSYILAGEGGYHVRVHFRYVVFRPFMNEVLVGKVKSSGTDGIHVSLGFFEDILIPPDKMRPMTTLGDDHLWIWHYDTDAGRADLHFDLDEQIRFKVIDEIFTEVGPPSTNPEPGKEQIPYKLIGSIDDDGLGLLKWWS